MGRRADPWRGGRLLPLDKVRGQLATGPARRQFTACSNVRGRGVEFHFVDSAGEEHDFSAKKCME